MARRKAFTLIELLVVIAIIGILAGIAIPIYGKIQQRSGAVACISNLREISTASMLYAGDNNNRLPGTRNANDTDNGLNGGLSQYFSMKVLNNLAYNSKSVFFCPVAYNLHKANVGGATKKSYAFNDRLDDTSIRFTGVPLSTVSRPSRCIYVCDAVWANSGTTWNATVTPQTSSSAAIHPAGQILNAMFFDGHVEGVTVTQAADTSTTGSLWNYDAQ